MNIDDCSPETVQRCPRCGVLHHAAVFTPFCPLWARLEADRQIYKGNTSPASGGLAGAFMTVPFFFQLAPAYLKGAPSPIVVPLLLCADVGGLDDQRAAAPSSPLSVQLGHQIWRKV